VDESLKADIMHWAAIYVSIHRDVASFNLIKRAELQEVRMRLGSKKIYHLEAWVVKVMSLYKVRHQHI
jgi:replication factor C subunit 3/5